MAAFGFSIGDFIAATSLVKDLILALQDGAGAKPQYQRLIAEVINVERALTEIQDLDFDTSLSSKKIALEQTVSQCQKIINDFLKKNTRFNPTLGIQSRASKWNLRANLHKIQ